MKKLLLLSGLCLLSSLSFAQKSDKTDCGFIQFIQPPMDYTLASNKTYYRLVTVPSNEMKIQSALEGEISLDGFEKISVRDQADFTVMVTVNQLIYESPVVKTVPKEKEENGVKTNYNMYKATAPYKMTVSTSIVLKDGSVVHEDVVNENGTLETAEQKSVEMAKQFFQSDMDSHKRKITTNAVKLMNTTILNKFCHLTVKKSFELVKVKPKKFDYDNFNKGVDVCAKAVPLYTAGFQTTDEIKSICIEAIDLWKKELAESNLEDNKARINKNLTAALYFNIGMAYFLMEEYDLAVTNLEKGHEVDGYSIALHSYWIEQAKSISIRKANKG
ncbi:MAG: tetratricopeptide repeat protein [Crocinitomicaceae bacterium]|nr:tetratricopeptide repeat protein [Crocinitomicaceae bacterium]